MVWYNLATGAASNLLITSAYSVVHTFELSRFISTFARISSILEHSTRFYQTKKLWRPTATMRFRQGSKKIKNQKFLINDKQLKIYDNFQVLNILKNLKILNTNSQ